MNGTVKILSPSDNQIDFWLQTFCVGNGHDGDIGTQTEEEEPEETHWDKGTQTEEDVMDQCLPLKKRPIRIEEESPW